MNTLEIIIAGIALAVIAIIYIDYRLFNRYRLRTKLIVTFVPLMLLSIIILSIFVDRGLNRALTSAANQSLNSAASEVASRIDTFFTTSIASLSTEAQLPDFVAFLDVEYYRPRYANQIEILESLTTKNPHQFILSYALLNHDGLDIVDTNSSNAGTDESSRDYFKIPVNEREPFISPVLFSEDGVPSIYLSAPVFGVNDDVVGVLRVQYDAAILQHLVEQSTGQAGEGSFAVLFDENLMHLAHGDEATAPEVNYKLLTLPTNTEWLTQMQAIGRVPQGDAETLTSNLPALAEKLTGGEQFFTAEDVATGEKLDQVAVTKLKSQPWTVAFFQPREVFLSPITVQRRHIFLLTIIIALGSIAFAVWLGDIITAPITRLTKVAQKVSKGQLDILASVDGEDEIAELAQVFNHMTGQLRQFITSLEDQVKERTKDLSLSMEVGQQAASIREEEKLLPTITQFIRDRFDLYYVQVYYVDDIRRNLVLRQGTGEVGKHLLGRRHKLPIGIGSIVGQVASTGQSIVVPNTELNNIHRTNPLLPDTRSELSVPLVVENVVIGVLDMQDDKAHTFTKENLTVFEAMATQLAIAIDSARQWTAAQESQKQAEQFLRQLTRDAWKKVLIEDYHTSKLGYTYNLSTLSTVEDPISPSEGDVHVPINIQGQTMGYLTLKLPEGRGESGDETLILKAVAQQLAQKIENLRLFEDTQRNAWRNQVISSATSKVWSSAEIETVMKLAVEELGEQLDASNVVIRLGRDVDWLVSLHDKPKYNGSNVEK